MSSALVLVALIVTSSGYFIYHRFIRKVDCSNNDDQVAILLDTIWDLSKDKEAIELLHLPYKDGDREELEIEKKTNHELKERF
jgi:hypothetical protein